MGRRQFLLAAGAGLTVCAFPRRVRAVQPRYPWPPGEEDYRDAKTGAYVRVLSTGFDTAECIYQTHPMWAKGMHYFVFFAIENGERIPMVRQMGSGLVRPLAERGVGAAVVDSERGDLYFMRERDLYRQPIESTFQRFRLAEKIAELPSFVHEVVGGLSLDADGTTLHAGAAITPDAEWGIVSLQLRANVWRTRCRTDFQVGHVQAHPRIPDLIMFCHETGGDAPQRMWRVMPGAETPQPQYREQGEEWVTHEVWWNNRALFTIWPYDEERLQYRYGIVSVDIQGGDAQWHAKYKAWHTHGSPDGTRILGDDFDRNLWLIAPYGQERRLLSQGHNGDGFTTHPHASFTPDSGAVISQSSALGREAVVLIEIPPWEELPTTGPAV